MPSVAVVIISNLEVLNAKKSLNVKTQPVDGALLLSPQTKAQASFSLLTMNTDALTVMLDSDMMRRVLSVLNVQIDARDAMKRMNVLNAKTSLKSEKEFVWSQMELISVSRLILRTDQSVFSVIMDTH